MGYHTIVLMIFKAFFEKHFPVRATSIDHFVALAQEHALDRVVGIPCGNTREVIPTYLHTNCWTEDTYVTFGAEVTLVGHFQAVFRAERSSGKDLVYLHDYGRSDRGIYDFQFLGAVRKTLGEIGSKIPGIKTELIYQ